MRTLCQQLEHGEDRRHLFGLYGPGVGDPVSSGRYDDRGHTLGVWQGIIQYTHDQ